MNKIKHTTKFEIAQPAEVLFPLFSAEGEKQWVPGWDYENIMGTTELHEDYIFSTETHDHGSTKAIWIIKKYDHKNFFIQFYKVEPEDKVGIITVACQKENEITTVVEVSYEYISLSDKGNKFIETFKKQNYDEFIDEWKTLLVKYFEKKCQQINQPDEINP